MSTPTRTAPRLTWRDARPRQQRARARGRARRARAGWRRADERGADRARHPVPPRPRVPRSPMVRAGSCVPRSATRAISARSCVRPKPRARPESSSGPDRPMFTIRSPSAASAGAVFGITVLEDDIVTVLERPRHARCAARRRGRPRWCGALVIELRARAALVLGHEARGLDQSTGRRAGVDSHGRRGRVVERRRGRHGAVVRGGAAHGSGARHERRRADRAGQRGGRRGRARRCRCLRSRRARRSRAELREGHARRYQEVDQGRRLARPGPRRARHSPRPNAVSAPRSRCEGSTSPRGIARPRHARPRRPHRAGSSYERGHLHPLTQAWRELEDIFIGLGYQVA